MHVASGKLQVARSKKQGASNKKQEARSYSAFHKKCPNRKQTQGHKISSLIVHKEEFFFKVISIVTF